MAIRRENRKRRFTLIELLVVVGIIGILLGLMMPAISKARAYAQSTYCKNNLRELGTALHTYANDYADYMPLVAAMPGLTIPEGYDSLYNYLHPYANSDKVFKCLADKGSATSTAVKESYYDDAGNYVEETSTSAAGVGSDFDYNKSSYEFNEFLCGRRLKLMSWAMLMHDYRTYHGMPGNPGAMNYLFADGHVGDFK